MCDKIVCVSQAAYSFIGVYGSPFIRLQLGLIPNTERTSSIPGCCYLPFCFEFYAFLMTSFRLWCLHHWHLRTHLWT